ncbi:MAG: dephospho-CoA kinase [Candidatus Cloacimonetes bacterium]|nr:dephospho-CoA kinase [Candidatus Cloacimonadota bacterium]MBL7107917.1 dephospho-CoA kinase [Candidatus Cloacimonadota bacterium]
MNWKNKVIIGITGGIATGKTTATNFFQKKGFYKIDADKIGHQILLQKNVKEKILANFGNKVISENEIDRKKLGKIVFQNREKLDSLNKIIHPILINKIFDKIETTKCKKVIIDAALLLDWKLDKICKYVILITSQNENKIKRLILNQKLSKKEAIERISSQKKLSGEIDFVIKNNSTLSEFEKKLKKIWNEMKLEI